jgi:hypothetical protein
LIHGIFRKTGRRRGPFGIKERALVDKSKN